MATDNDNATFVKDLFRHSDALKALDDLIGLMADEDSYVQLLRLINHEAQASYERLQKTALELL